MARNLLAAAPLAAFAAAVLVPSAPVAAQPAPRHAQAVSPDDGDDVETKLDELAQTIADLSDRLSAIEDAIDPQDDQDGAFDGDSLDGVDLAHAQAGHGHVQLHRPIHSLHTDQQPACSAPLQGTAPEKRIGSRRASQVAKSSA